MFLKYFLMIIGFVIFASGFSNPPSSFNQAKKVAGHLFADHATTLYCQCHYENKAIDLSSCGMLAAQDIKRAHRMEWEHMMPAEQFGRHFSCWQEPLCEKNAKRYKGRACCERINQEYRQLEAELYNLWPAVGLVNSARSNYRFAALSSSAQQVSFFGCSLLIDRHSKRVEPANHAKGIVARAHLFIEAHYKIPLSPTQKALFLDWNKHYAPTDWEVLWAKRVAEIEGYENPWIVFYEDYAKLDE